MKKIIKKFGGSFIIRITPEEMKVYDLSLGDIIDVEIAPIKTRRVIRSK